MKVLCTILVMSHVFFSMPPLGTRMGRIIRLVFSFCRMGHNPSLTFTSLRKGNKGGRIWIFLFRHFLHPSLTFTSLSEGHVYAPILRTFGRGQLTFTSVREGSFRRIIRLCLILPILDPKGGMEKKTWDMGHNQQNNRA